MKLPQFVTPHSHIKSLDSASTPKAFVKRLKELESKYFTVTDHGQLGACREIYDLAHKEGLIPILGLEGYLRDPNCEILTKFGIPKNEKGDFSDFIKYLHITMHFQDQEAYQTGVRILSKADERAERHGSERKPLFTWNDLEELGSKNVVFGSSCLIGCVQGFLLRHNNPELATAYYDKLRSIVKPGNFIVEIFPNDCSRNWETGVWITLEDGSIIKEYFKKKFKTNNSDEIEALDLVKEFNRKDNKHKQLLAIKEYKTWKELKPLNIVKVEKIEDFLPNECTPFAPNGDPQAGANKFVIELANKYRDKCVISDDSHYAYPDDSILQDIKLMSNGQSNWRFYGNYALKSSQEAYDHFQKTLDLDIKTCESWIDNSHEWASKFDNFKWETKPSLPTKFYPQDTIGYTYELIEKHGRMDWSKPDYIERLKNEIELFHKNGKIDLLPYFFLAEEVCDYYEQNQILTGPGRGSSGGVLLAYALGITHADPIKWELSLERFLTKDRINSGKLPDIDMDFGDRSLILDKTDGLLERRFKGHYAQIGTDTKLKLRSTVKDVHRALYKEVPKIVEELTKEFENAPQGVEDIDHVLGYNTDEKHVPGSIERDEALQEYVKRYPKEWELVKRLLGIKRTTGRHPSAYVIVNEPISNLIPTMSINDELCTQYTMESVEAVGGIKMDFLSVNSLLDIDECIKNIQERSGIKLNNFEYIDGKKVPKVRIVPFEGKLYDIWDLPEKQEVFDYIVVGNTETVFQLNTPGAIKGLKEFSYTKQDGKRVLDSRYSMAIFTALDRPGPLDAKIVHKDSEHNMLVEYSRRARGLERGLGLEALDNLIPETHDILIFQESVEKIYRYLTGCSKMESEDFRYNLGKKRKAKIEKAYKLFIEKASDKIGNKNAQAVWDAIQTFSSYGFNKSHALFYGAVLGYATGFLKFFFPLEWWCSVLKNATKNEVAEKFWRYCSHMVDMPEISKSKESFSIVNNKIIAPLDLIQGVGERAHNELYAGRPFKDITDFCQKIQKYKEDNKKPKENGKERLATSALNRKVVYNLILAGTMDSLFSPDAGLFEKLQTYEEALALTSNKKQVPVDNKYIKLTPLERHQLVKKIFPIYNQDLIPLIKDMPIEGFKYDESNGFASYKKDKNMYYIKNWKGFNGILSLGGNGPQHYGVIGYIKSQRMFKWGDNKEKESCELVIDIEGNEYKMVKWPNRNSNKINPIYKIDLAGSIGIVLASRFRSDRAFSVDDVIILQEPLKEDKGENDESEQSK